MFPQGFSSPTVLRFLSREAWLFSHTGLSPPMVALPSGVLLTSRFVTSRQTVKSVQKGPATLNTT